MNADPAIDTFRKLSQLEKILLIQDLWDEIAGEIDSLSISEVQRPLLDE